MNDPARLSEIERELDKTAPWEIPPYRSLRARLNRDRARIVKRMDRQGPLYHAGSAAQQGGAHLMTETSKPQIEQNANVDKAMQRFVHIQRDGNSSEPLSFDAYLKKAIENPSSVIRNIFQVLRLDTIH